MDLAAGAVAPAVVEVPQVAGNKLTKLIGIDTLKGQYLGHRYFTKSFLAELSEYIAESETQHQAELVVAVERSFPAHLDLTRDRALEIFGRLRVWDTPLNTGVLLYLSLERQAIEIIADRGIEVEDERWVEVSTTLARSFKNKQFCEGLQAAVKQIGEILTEACPYPDSAERSDGVLANEPVIL
ncbi:hypothetical protein AAEX37_00053 [Oligella sp. MSHR50489EDL]